MRELGWWYSLRYMGNYGLCVTKPVEITNDKELDWVYCGKELLQYKSDYSALLCQWFSKLKEGGALCLFVPDVRYHETDGLRLTHDDLLAAVDRLHGWLMMESEIIEGHSFIVLLKAENENRQAVWRKRDKHMAIVRTGAYGDALMAASILPQLKEEGWHITFYAGESGYKVLQHDPHIDELIEIKKGHIQDGELADWLAATEKRYDRFINLIWSVESAALARQQDGHYYWPDAQRRQWYGNIGYVSVAHMLADLPYKPAVRFYPSLAETHYAQGVREKIGPYLMVVLSGSAVHKWYPHFDKVIVRLLNETDYSILLCGDHDSKDLEAKIIDTANEYYGNAERIYSAVGNRTIRDCCALAQQADCVIGPETGILNAVSYELTPKVLLLSHSSKQNLGFDWVNAEIVEPLEAKCYPCHRLHFDGHKYCPQDTATQAAVCASSVKPATMFNAIIKALGRANDSIKTTDSTSNRASDADRG